MNMAFSTSTPFFSTLQNSNTNHRSPVFLHKQAPSSINAFFSVFKLRPQFYPSSRRRPIFTVPSSSSSRDPSHSSYDVKRFVSGVSTTCTPKVAFKIIESYLEGYRHDWGHSFQKDNVSRGGCFTSEEDNGGQRVECSNRRQVILSSVGFCAGCLLNTASYLAAPHAVAASSRSGFADMPALKGKDYGKTKMRYPDYTETESGLQFKDLRIGTGPTPKIGETVVVDWDGYTIGYYGRIFEARNKTKGGSFEGGDKDFFKFKIGSQEVIPAFEEAVTGMSSGGIRRIIVPPELGYPDNDYNNKGPKPTTFSGQRALDFVLRNQGLIDKTLLFDIELLKIIPN